jgi:hypothetical protein
MSDQVCKQWFVASDLEDFSKSETIFHIIDTYNKYEKKYYSKEAFSKNEKYDYLLSIIAKFCLANLNGLKFFQNKKNELQSFFMDIKCSTLNKHLEDYKILFSKEKSISIKIDGVNIFTLIDQLIFDFFNSSHNLNAYDKNGEVYIYSRNKSVDDVINGISYLANGELVCAGIKFNSSIRYEILIDEDNITWYVNAVSTDNYDYNQYMYSVVGEIEKNVFKKSCFDDYWQVMYLHNQIHGNLIDTVCQSHYEDFKINFEGYGIGCTQSLNINQFLKKKDNYYALFELINDDPYFVLDCIKKKKIVITPWAFFLFTKIDAHLVKCFFQNSKEIRLIHQYEDMVADVEQGLASDALWEAMGNDEIDSMREDSDGAFEWNID